MMKRIWFKLLRRERGLKLWGLCPVIAAVLSAGCHILPPMPNTVQDMGPRYRPTNIYRRTNALPAQIRRVAMLPLVATDPTAFLRDGVESLGPLLGAELEKCKRFEVIPVSPEQLRQWTGQKGWRTDEPLPPDFFAHVANATGCDAILFCQLTRYQPYQPIAVGWKFSLVANLPTGSLSMQEMKDKILWCADEVLDAGDAAVGNAARDYYGQHLHNETPAADASSILTSPTRFGQYTLAALFDTLPGRVVACRVTELK
jgi:hypothetical protein